MNETKPAPQDQITFEEAIERLEEIVGGMESEQMPLEQMVAAYEEGAKLLKTCRSRIEQARQRVELIGARMDEPEETTLSPFDPAQSAEASPENEPSRNSPARSPGRRSSSSAASKQTSNDDEDIRLL